MDERDIQAIRLVGSLAVGVGVILLILTGLTTLLLLFGGGSSDIGQFVQGTIAILVAILMSSTLISCGMILARTRMYTNFDSDALRLNWTALFIMMCLGAVANLWLVPPLTIVAGFILIGLLLIRIPIIRVTNR